MPHKDQEKRRAYLKEWRQKNVEHVRQKQKESYSSPEGFAIYKNSRLKRMYGITLKQYDEMFSKQNGVCFICGKPETRYNKRTQSLAVDHDHVTGKVRKLLCINCNRGLGAFGDDIILMERGIQYIKDHK